MIDLTSLLPEDTRIIPASGSLSAPVALVGEAPGQEEYNAGKPFVGKAGNLLDKCLQKANLPRRDLYITNTIKEWPGKGNNIAPFFKVGKNKPGEFTERGLKYVQMLKEELSGWTGNVILAAGAIALKALCDLDGITKWHGSILESTLLPGRKVIPMIHPAAALRQYIQSYFITQSLRKANREKEFPQINHPQRTLITNPSWSQAYQWLMDTKKDWNGRMSIDIETSGQLELSCIGLCYNTKEAICLPIAQYSEEHELLAMLEIEKIISNPELYLIGQNFNFDLQFLIKRYHIHPAYKPSPYTIGDTMIGHNVLYPDFPANLGFIGTMYTDEPYYKDDKKEWKNVKDWNRFWEYNCKDVITTMKAWDVIEPTLKRQGFWDTYLMDVRKHYPMFFVQTKGMNTNPEAIEKTKAKIISEIKITQAKLDKEVLSRCPDLPEVDAIPKMGIKGYLNVGSDTQVKDYFYTRLRIPAYKSKGKDTTDDTALRRIAKGTSTRQGYPEALTIQTLRGLRKFYDTYLEMEFDDDVRFRCTYNPRGTIFGRYSSRETIFHTGMNQQNLPAEFKHFLLADPGYLLWVLDGEQAEWVSTAFIAGERKMIKVMEDYWAGIGPDPHTATASMITGLSIDLVKQEEQYFEEKNLGHTSDLSIIASARKEIFKKDLAAEAAYKRALFIPTTMTLRQAGKKCLVPDTEVLTPTGWITIDRLTTQHKIMTWDQEKLSFSQVKEMHEYPVNEYLLELSGRYLHQIVTKEHKLIVGSNRTKKYKSISAENFDQIITSDTFLPLVGDYASKGYTWLDSPDVIRLLVAIQADGWVRPHGGLNLGVFKKRKCVRAESILKALKLKYTQTTQGYYLSLDNPIVQKMKALLAKEKLFGPYLLQLSSETLDAFLEELPYWDGMVSKKLYMTTVQENAIWAQTISHLRGRRCSIYKRAQHKSCFGKKPVYCLTLSSVKRVFASNLSVKEIPYKGKVYCPTVPSGAFLIRSQGKISVTGNSNHGFNYGMGSDKFSIEHTIPLADARRSHTFYHRGYSGLEKWYQRLQRELRTLENPFGRRVRLLGRWEHSLFNQAYSFKPQSTVADLTIQEGLFRIFEDDVAGDPIVTPSELMFQEHDGIGYQYPTTDLHKMAQFIHRIKSYLESPITVEGRTFTIKAEAKCGYSWGSMKKVDVSSVESIEAGARKFIEENGR